MRKCPYCDFNSFTLHGQLPEQAYVAALCADLAAQALHPAAAGRTVGSVFLGGGTPSLFSPRAIADVLQALATALPLAPDAEVTLEANPATIERGMFAEYRAAGVNRVSLGAQTFDAAALKALGRVHVPADVHRSAEELHASGLSNFNLDLMFALPGQARDGALADLRAALALEPAHISHYQLTLEPGTVFAALPPRLPDDDLAWEMQQDCHALLAGEGFDHYEVSAFARPGRRCRHNLNYWSFGDYLGIGAGAHGKLTAPGSGHIMRSVQPREPRRYQGEPVGGLQWRDIPVDEVPFEYHLNALRLVDGFQLADLRARTGLDPATLRPTWQALADRGLLQLDDTQCRATPRGLQFLNDLLEPFLAG